MKKCSSVADITIKQGDTFAVESNLKHLAIDALSEKELDCDFGAGEIIIDSLSVTSKADINGGAREITISNGTFDNLDL